MNQVVNTNNYPKCAQCSQTEENFVETKVNVDGTTFHFLNGQLHRTDGPAIENVAKNIRRWFYEGKEMSNKQVYNKMYDAYCDSYAKDMEDCL